MRQESNLYQKNYRGNNFDIIHNILKMKYVYMHG